MSCIIELRKTAPPSLYIEICPEFPLSPSEKIRHVEIISKALTDEFPHIKKLILRGHGFLEFDFEEYRQILRKIPRRLHSLDLAGNYLSRFTPSELELLVFSLPPELKYLNASRNDLNTEALIYFLNGLRLCCFSLEQLDIRQNRASFLNKIEIISIWQTLPNNLTRCLMDSTDLSDHPAEHIIQLVSHYPPPFRTLHLNFSVGGWSAELVFLLLNNLPKHVNKLILAIRFPQDILPIMNKAWQNLPPTVHEIEILDTSSQKSWSVNLPLFISRLNIRKLNLSRNHLGALESHEVVRLTRAISRHTVHLDLSFNQLTETTIPFIFAGLSEGLRILRLHGNGLEHLPAEKLISYFKFLPQTNIEVQFGKWRFSPRTYDYSSYLQEASQPHFCFEEPEMATSPILGDPVRLGDELSSMRKNSHWRFFNAEQIEAPAATEENGSLAVTKSSSIPRLLMPTPVYPGWNSR
ncbi:Leucine-rich repeat protein [Legionella birminghamensis]|uniref:Leucine-rich repeat protein n=1 Tax=Legionella birminghamensis TaxID=28083 RepID=A0A378IDB5_9GAMM|nr:hypothetical protein [Legionella birminghamensis]KTC75499.1 Leucine-rich repeat protein [Legionella birminghamensis]STX32725.1 Leucine-rich repeat protein [Legionella birminghamensis]